MNQKKVLLAILDGVGWRQDKNFNAYEAANNPLMKELFTTYPNRLIRTDGPFVGLPEGTMGNSEVGHMTIGAGRIYFQDLSRINQEIETKSFFSNPVLKKIFETSKRTHFSGLISDWGVHTHLNHLKALVQMAGDLKKEYYIHPITDGRDTKPGSCFEFLKNFDPSRFGVIGGRYYAMDRDKRWERTKLFYDALVDSRHVVTNDSWRAYVTKEGHEKRTDEFLLPALLNKKAQIQPGDGIIFFNYRADRMRQIVSAFFDEKFSNFPLHHRAKDLNLASFSSYEDSYPLHVAFPKESGKNILGEILDQNKITQLRIAETEKFAHVTFFLNSSIDQPFKTEIRNLVQSPKDVATYDLKPEMSAHEIATQFYSELKKHPDIRFVCLNFANGDMVGHTGSMEAATKAVEAVDQALKKVLDTWLMGDDHVALVTADHGNCELMQDELGNPHTQHTTFPVKIAITDKKLKFRDGSGGLADIAPTILQLFDIPQPKEMTGKSLIL